MEVDADGTGGESVADTVTEPDRTTDTRARSRTNAVLYVVALVTACAAVLVGLTIVRADDAPAAPAVAGELTASTPEERERFDDVVAAASEVATAFVNIRYDDVDASLEAVQGLATGEFADQYEESTQALLEVLGGSRAVMTGEVVWAGVVTSDADSATVLVATSGTVANNQTGEEPVARTFRLQIQLADVEGEWKASDLQFVEELT